MQQLAALSIICCWLFCSDADAVKKVFDDTDDPPHHFDITPEVVQILTNLIELDRAALKTIMEIEATVLRTCFSDIIMDGYTLNSTIGNCFVKEARSHYDNWPRRLTVVNDKTDFSLNAMTDNWFSNHTQNYLEAYWTQFWKDRNKVYQYATRKVDVGLECSNIASDSCTGFSSLHVVLMNVHKDVRAHCGLPPPS